MTIDNIKKWISMLLCLLTIFALFPAISVAAENKNVYRLGDLNDDSRITVEDARLCLCAAVKIKTLAKEQEKAADVFNNGKITVANARIILRAAVKIEAIKEKDVTLKVGEKYTYTTLHSGSMYQWFCSISPDNGVDIIYSFYNPYKDTDLMGGGIEETYAFSAKEPGVYTVYLKLDAPWINDPIEEITFTITVTE